MQLRNTSSSPGVVRKLMSGGGGGGACPSGVVSADADADRVVAPNSSGGWGGIQHSCN